VGPDPATAQVRRAVRLTLSRIEPGALVLAACSGGADSLALAGALAFEAPKSGHRAGAITVDHRLQDGSAERAVDTTETLKDMGLEPVESIAVDVGARGGPEAAARDARYTAFDQVARRLDARAVLLGHTRDDQAETVLLGLARGSGARSLAGMREESGLYRRPLLDLDRALTRRACVAMGLVPWDDPHNHDPSYTRVRVRHDVLPVLEKAFGPGVAEALARTARLLADDADALDGWADEAAEEVADAEGRLDAELLATLPAAIRGRVLRRAAVAAGSSPGALAAVHIHAVDALVIGWHGQSGVDLPGGVRATRRYGKLLFGRP
jgi:tRNA(Ile)-lysidine synthase